MYKTKDFETLINEVLINSGLKDKQLSILKLINQSATKWYEKTYEPCEFLEKGVKYGVIIDGVVEFDFKVGGIDSLFKSFLRAFCSKVKVIDVNNFMDYLTREQLLDRIVSSNKDRVYRGCFYTTLYGIGFWSIFSTKENKEVAKGLHSYLIDAGITFTNEWSDAGWVYRFVIKQGVATHNKLLNDFVI